MSLPNSNFYLMSQFKTNGKGFNRAIGLKPGNDNDAPLPLLTLSTKIKVINTEKEAKRKLQQ
ncbi:hypothetical protein [Mucilaginibacter sp.]|uniref:hypothetical protein n=1 Tax=Mucilaginibacter sp. TaxID=1882438 RepID=UPI00260F319B|nr:hypothetical protein [Mucilaginibacter sp.]